MRPAVLAPGECLLEEPRLRPLRHVACPDAHGPCEPVAVPAGLDHADGLDIRIGCITSQAPGDHLPLQRAEQDACVEAGQGAGHEQPSSLPPPVPTRTTGAGQ